MKPAAWIYALGCALNLAACSDGGQTGSTATPAAATTAVAQLGQALFNEKALSSTGTQSCAGCHAAASAFADPDASRPVSEGAVSGRFGTRNAPTAMYASRVPPLHQATAANGNLHWVGGLFHDGRADTLEIQARAPLFNALEMNLVDAVDLRARLRASGTASLYESVYGANTLADGSDADAVVGNVASAIAAFERTGGFAPFTSKFDAVARGTATFTAQEAQGHDIFVRRDKGACAGCHDIAPGANGEPPLFTNLAYENLGLPRNPDRAYYAADFVDSGLEATLLGRGVDATTAANARGRFRVATLRNVALTAPYMHNGVFADLKTVVEFYNTRDTDPARWAAIGAVEVPETVNHVGNIGHLGLTADEVDAVVAFLGTLSDGYTGG